MTDDLWMARNEMTSAAGDIGNLCTLMGNLAEGRDPIEPAAMYALITALTSIEGRLDAAAEKIGTAPAIAA